MGDVIELGDRKLSDRLGAPAHPPRAWFFDRPDWFEDGENGIRVITTPGPDLGRAAGRPYDWETCWMNSATGRCEPVTPSPTGCEVFYSGGSSVTCADGTAVPVGVIPYRGGHAPRAMSVDESRNWMDNPAYQGLVGRVVEDDHGGIFLGQVIPELTVEDALLIERSKISGDWRWRYGMRDPDTGRPIGDGYDFVGLSIVSLTATPRSASAHGRRRVEYGYARVAGLDPDHPVIVGPWVDLTVLPEEDLMCPRCGIDHPETLSCHQARVAAPEPPVDEPAGEPAAGEPAAAPDVGQSDAATEPKMEIPASLDLRQLLVDVQTMTARLSEVVGRVEEIESRAGANAERIEQIAQIITDIEVRLAEMDRVELNADDAEKLADLERAVSQIRDTQNTAPAVTAGESVPAPQPAAG